MPWLKRRCGATKVKVEGVESAYRVVKAFQVSEELFKEMAEFATESYILEL